MNADVHQHRTHGGKQGRSDNPNMLCQLTEAGHCMAELLLPSRGCHPLRTHLTGSCATVYIMLHCCFVLSNGFHVPCHCMMHRLHMNPAQKNGKAGSDTIRWWFIAHPVSIPQIAAQQLAAPPCVQCLLGCARSAGTVVCMHSIQAATKRRFTSRLQARPLKLPSPVVLRCHI